MLNRFHRPLLVAAASLVTIPSYKKQITYQDKPLGINQSHQAVLSNWSNTHTCHIQTTFEPINETEVLTLLQYAQANKMKLRPVGNF